MKRVFGIVILLLLTAGSASSHRGADVDIRFVSDTGREFLSIPWSDASSGSTRVIKRYLEAVRGENYRVFVRNNTPDRIGLVIAVDGRNIITGKKSCLGRNESMYILGPREQEEYNGWRTGQDTINRFYFTSEEDSYAERTFGDSSAMGVIAVAVFREKEVYRHLKQHQRSESSAPVSPAPGKLESEAMREDAAGTGFGSEEYSPSVTVNFTPEHEPARKILVKYEWRDTLCRKGILHCRREKPNRLWDESSYAPYPPNYR